jgi:hypothetical protein
VRDVVVLVDEEGRDRRLPVVALVCPPGGETYEASELARSLGHATSPGDRMRYVPLESGLLVELLPVRQGSDRLRRSGGWEEVEPGVERLGEGCELAVTLSAIACRKHVEGGGEGWIWLPSFAALRDGRVVLEPEVRGRDGAYGREGVWYWDSCEPWWVVELVDRLARIEVEGLAERLAQGEAVRLVGRRDVLLG